MNPKPMPQQRDAGKSLEACRSRTRIELKVISVKHFKEEAAEFVKCIAKVEFRGES